MFARWLALWHAETSALMSPEDAAILQRKAQEQGERMGEALFGAPSEIKP